MKHSAKLLYYLLLIISVSVTMVFAAAPTKGVPPFQSFGGGPDIINLGNLNVHYSFPIFSRAGRGIPFYYALAYDTSVWTPAGTVWVPSNLGLYRDSAARVGVANFITHQSRCQTVDNGQWEWFNVYTFTSYTDSAGTWHYFSLGVNDRGSVCDGGNPTATGTATDGSGITMTVNADPLSASVTLRSGEKLGPILSSGGSSSGGGPQTDSNGNQITSSVNGNITSFYDTLSATTPVMTIDNTNALSVLYKYTNPGNTTTTITVSYKNYNVQTNFGCSGINEYGPISNSLPDKITLPGGSYYQFTYEPTLGGPTGNVTGRLHSLKLPTGGTITYDYTGGDTGKGIFCADGSTAGFTRTTLDGQWTYARTGTSPNYTTTITTPVDPTSGQANHIVINFQGEFETLRKVYQGPASGTPLLTLTTCYNGTSQTPCPGTTVATPFAQITTLRSLNGGPQSRVDTQYNGYGLVTKQDVYGFGDSAFTRETTTAYATLGNNINDHPSSVIVTDGVGNMKSKTTYGYDQTTVTATSGTPNHISVTGARGNLTTITNYVTSAATLSRTFTYYDTGTTKTATDVNAAVTTYSYAGTSCGNSFPTSITLPLSLSRSMAWNCTGAVMTTATDENLNPTTSDYGTDPFWRVTSITDPINNITSMRYNDVGSFWSDSTLSFNNSEVQSGNGLDGLGREIVTNHRQAPGSTSFDTFPKSYDSMGRLWKIYMPCTSTTWTCPTPFTSISYDALNRPLVVTDGGGGTVTTSYTKNDVLQTVGPPPAGENIKRKQTEYDGLGRLSWVCEITSSSNSGACGQSGQTGYWTKYIYDTLPNVNSLTVNQNAQTGGGTMQARTYIYDMLGRLTSEGNPESGTATYVYDSDATCGSSKGDLVKRTDAVGNVTCYAYDTLHRVTSITYPSGTYAANTSKKYFVYDTATVNGIAMANAKGQLAEAYTCTTCPGTKITDFGFSYSARGELTDTHQKTLHTPGYVHVTASYWPHGGLHTLSGIPGLSRTFTYTPDSEGRISMVSDNAGTTLVSSTSYNEAGQVTGVTLGSGDSDSFVFDPNTGRMGTYNYSVGSTLQILTGSLTWNANGTLKQLAINDPFNAGNTQTCSYGYDDLARISSTGCGSTWSQTFSFDPFGNITKSGTSNWLPGYNQSTNRYTLGGTTYDANGNLTNDTFQPYTWESDGKLHSLGSISIINDALGHIAEFSGTVTNERIYGPTGQIALLSAALNTNGALYNAYIPLPGGAQAVYNASGLLFYNHVDYLGTSRLATTPSRTVYFDQAYAPYGESYQRNITPSDFPVEFAGMFKHLATGYFDTPNREYHPVQGRWISPDPAGLAAVAPSSPQTWNRYAYVGNMPLNAVDPLGLMPRGSDVAPKPHYYNYTALSLLSIISNQLEQMDITTQTTSVQSNIIPIFEDGPDYLDMVVGASSSQTYQDVSIQVLVSNMPGVTAWISTPTFPERSERTVTRDPGPIRLTQTQKEALCHLAVQFRYNAYGNSDVYTHDPSGSVAVGTNLYTRNGPDVVRDPTLNAARVAAGARAQAASSGAALLTGKVGDNNLCLNILQ